MNRKTKSRDLIVETENESTDVSNMHSIVLSKMHSNEAILFFL